jgi:hypothetical protein
MEKYYTNPKRKKKAARPRSPWIQKQRTTTHDAWKYTNQTKKKTKSARPRSPFGAS